MDLEISDYNSAEASINKYSRLDYAKLEGILTQMPLHLKNSDQKGIAGSPIFNPVGTNNYIKRSLESAGWGINLPIPEEFSFLGTNIDFFNNGLLCEVQFSNYPFLLNNLLRSELFHKSKLLFSGHAVRTVVIITKARMFPASNSTLYYEQAKRQLDELSKYSIFDVPIRLVGLFFNKHGRHDAKWTRYEEPRYSRTILEERSRAVMINKPAALGGRSRISYLD